MENIKSHEESKTDKPSWWFTLGALIISPIVLYIDMSINVHGGVGLTIVLAIYLMYRIAKHLIYYSKQWVKQ